VGQVAVGNIEQRIGVGGWVEERTLGVECWVAMQLVELISVLL